MKHSDLSSLLPVSIVTVLEVKFSLNIAMWQGMISDLHPVCMVRPAAPAEWVMYTRVMTISRVGCGLIWILTQLHPTNDAVACVCGSISSLRDSTTKYY